MTAQTSTQTIRRIGSLLTMLLAANVHVLVRSTDPYVVGRSTHAIFAWVSLFAFWGALAYLIVSIGYIFVQETAPRQDGEPTPTDD